MLTNEIETLADLLRISADVARRIANARSQHRVDISELADRIEDVAVALQVIIKKERESAASNGGL